MITKITDTKDLVKTSKYKHGKFPFEHFNPVQSKVFEYYDKDNNCIIASSTSSGKTICSELFIGDEIHGKGGKAMYLVPLRALAQERLDDWEGPDCHLGKLRVSVCTGDYKLTASRKAELDSSDLIVMTSEMLNSRTRNHRSESSEFLKAVKTLVIDETHLIASSGRGDHLESGLMKFSEINPECRLIGLSATLPNVTEIGEWFSKLNGKPTIVLESKYRPCPLNIHYVKYNEVSFGYEKNEEEKVRQTIKIVEEHMTDKFLLFVHTKRTGEMLHSVLKERGIQCEYHNADLTKEKRVSIENRFREDPKLRCLVATSTVAAGINVPARRVVVVGVHRGLSEVETQDILQECGRAGRPQYDPQGDAYVLLPSKTFDKQKTRLESQSPIQSRIGEGKCLAFHLTSEVHHRNIQSDNDVHDWYERSLAHHQAKELNSNVVTEVMNGLTRCGAMVEDEGVYDVTSIGTVASMFYYSPFDVSDLSRNWTKVFEKDKSADDYWISMALANIDSHRMGITSSGDREEMSKYGLKLEACEKVLGGSRSFMDGAVKIGCCYFNMLKGYNSLVMGAVQRGLQMDCERVIEVLCALDQMTGKWHQREYFRRLYLRLLYGVEEEMVDIVRLKNIGKIKGKRLWDANLRSLDKISGNVLGIIKALNCSKLIAEGISENAKELIKNDKYL